MHIAVTGAAGFIGSTVTDLLLDQGQRVLGVDNFATGTRENLERALNHPDFSLSELDVTTEALSGALEQFQPEVVCHLAAQIDVRASVTDPVADAHTNVVGTVRVLEAARRAGARKVIFTSSGGSIYGEPAALPVSEAAPVNPLSPYAAAKVCGEVYLTMFGALYGLQTTSLALGNVYGPRQDPHGEAGVVSIFGSALLGGRPTTIFGDGTSSRDYVYVADVAEAFALACGRAADGLRLNIGTGLATPVRELHGLVAAAAHAPDRPSTAPPRLGELQAVALDYRLAQRELGWSPATPLAEGIGATVDWLRSNRS